ncbi:hypothetical protein V8D89_009375 [Ganoderma adspersum]
MLTDDTDGLALSQCGSAPTPGAQDRKTQARGCELDGKQGAQDASSRRAEHAWRRRNDTEERMWPADGHFREPTRYATGTTVVAKPRTRAEDTSTNALRACEQGLAGYLGGCPKAHTAPGGGALSGDRAYQLRRNQRPRRSPLDPGRGFAVQPVRATAAVGTKLLPGMEGKQPLCLCERTGLVRGLADRDRSERACVPEVAAGSTAMRRLWDEIDAMEAGWLLVKSLALDMVRNMTQWDSTMVINARFEKAESGWMTHQPSGRATRSVTSWYEEGASKSRIKLAGQKTFYVCTIDTEKWDTIYGHKCLRVPVSDSPEPESQSGAKIFSAMAQPSGGQKRDLSRARRIYWRASAASAGGKNFGRIIRGRLPRFRDAVVVLVPGGKKGMKGASAKASARRHVAVRTGGYGRRGLEVSQPGSAFH